MVCFLVLGPFIFIFSICSRFTKPASHTRLVWGDSPIINNKYWSEAMSRAGYTSVMYTDGYCSTINQREDYGFLLNEQYPFMPTDLARYLAFLECLLKYDVFFVSFTGFFIGKTPLWRTEAFFLKLAGKKVVVIPFGLDAYIYNRVKNVSLVHGLMMSIPAPSRKQPAIAAKVDYWCKYADVIISTTIGPDGIGRWDILVPNTLCIDIYRWSLKKNYSKSDGVDNNVYIVHAPNHRGFKGTEFVIDSVELLKAEGFMVELILIEGMKNSKVKEVLENKADILVEQLVATGHGLNGLEGMATGNPVISNFEDEEVCKVFRRWSFLEECPIVSGCPENLTDVLRKLVISPDLRQTLGRAGRRYVEKYHSYQAMEVLFSKVLDKLNGKEVDLINLFHPLLGDYRKAMPKVKHPLIKNRIVKK